MAWLGAGNLAQQSSSPELENTQEQVFAFRREHRKIWKAIKMGDKTRAKQAMEEQLLRVEKQYLKNLKTEREMSPDEHM